jgi:hypothetical protein
MITTPASGATYNQGDAITFTGTATDTEDGSLTSGITWTSSLNGNIGTGGLVTTSSLSVGTHTITARVTDTGGLAGQAQITITVAAVNHAPMVTITAPASGATYNQGDSIRFRGTATDTEDGTLTSRIAWTSSLDSSIGTGGSVTTSSLSAGTHTITARVSDTGGLAGQAQITVVVNPPSMPPAAPTSLKANVSQGISLVWRDNSSNETGFEIERCGGLGCTNFVLLGSVGPNVTTFKDSSVSRQTTYSYRVRAVNQIGASGYSNIVAATTK